MFKIKLLTAICAGFLALPLGAWAESGKRPFEQALLFYTQDGVLDKREYLYLQSLLKSQLPTQDRILGEHFLSFAAQHRSFIHMQYSFYQGQKQITLKFAFAPTYAEDSLIQGQTPRAVLGQISQNDTLQETHADAERCGAAALLSAHYLLYGSFQRAFSRLGLPEAAPTFRAVHLAQEQLYHLANTDGQPGLTSQFRYTLYQDGRIENPVSEGEIKNLAAFLHLDVKPLIGETKATMYARQRVVQAFWALYPEAPLLVGVYLNEKSGEVRPPQNPTYPQNHFVLVFREAGRHWMLNSGVLDNGSGQALQELNAQQMQGFVYQTTGSLDALTRNGS